MDPQQPSNFGHELPAVPKQENYNQTEKSAETISITPESAASILPPPPAQAVTTQSQMTPQTPQALNGPALQGPTQTSAHPSSPAVADDLDLIEKEWVTKAKAIVDKTRTDPYNQNKEMNRFKADYMSKRYNKEIKIEP